MLAHIFKAIPLDPKWVCATARIWVVKYDWPQKFYAFAMKDEPNFVITSVKEFDMVLHVPHGADDDLFSLKLKW